MTASDNRYQHPAVKEKSSFTFRNARPPVKLFIPLTVIDVIDPNNAVPELIEMKKPE
jgi:hypothetical protein